MSIYLEIDDTAYSSHLLFDYLTLNCFLLLANKLSILTLIIGDYE